MSIRCVSSYLMSELLAWRNLSGRQENWSDSREVSPAPDCTFYAKNFITEPSLMLIAGIAALETIVNAILVILSLVLYPLTDAPYRFMAAFLSSSSFTILWAIADFFHPCQYNLMTRESHARFIIQMTVPFPLVRPEDGVEIVLQHGNNRPRSSTIRNFIEQGGAFFVQDVLAGLDEPTRDLFRSLDTRRLHSSRTPEQNRFVLFILTKAIFVYAFGARRDVAPPAFFKPETGEGILRLREIPMAPSIQELAQMINTPGFDLETLNDEAWLLHGFSLQHMATQESQSILLMRCWERAQQLLPPAPPV